MAQAEQSSVEIRITWVRIRDWLAMLCKCFLFSSVYLPQLCVCVYMHCDVHLLIRDEEIKVQWTVIILLFPLLQLYLKGHILYSGSAVKIKCEHGVIGHLFTFLTAFSTFNHIIWSSLQLPEANPVVSFLIEMRKLKSKEVMEFVWGPTARTSTWGSRGTKPAALNQNSHS